MCTGDDTSERHPPRAGLAVPWFQCVVQWEAWDDVKNSSSELYAMLHKILIAYNNTADQRMEPKGIIVRMGVFQ